MKILFLSGEFPPESNDIAGVIVFSLAKFYSAHGHQVFVVSASRSREGIETTQEGFKKYQIQCGYHTKWNAYLGLYNRKVAKKLRVILEEIKPDVVNAHSLYFSLSYHSLKLAQQAGAKVFLTAHDPMLYSYSKVPDESKRSWFEDFKNFKWRYNPLRNTLIKHHIKSVKTIIAVSGALGRALKNNGIGPVTAINNGINIDEWAVPQEDIAGFKRFYGLDDKKIVLFSGRLSGAKGCMKIIEAMAKVIKELPDSVLLVAGKKEGYGEIMRKYAIEKKFDKQVIFTGWLSRDEMKKAYFASGVVVTPSLYLDPFPTVNLEAMAAKKPVVGTCFGGTPEIVVDNETGYIIDPNDIGVMANKMLSLLKDQTLASKFGEAGHERLKNYFSLKHQAESYLREFSKN